MDLEKKFSKRPKCIVKGCGHLAHKINRLGMMLCDKHFNQSEDLMNETIKDLNAKNPNHKIPNYRPEIVKWNKEH